MLVYLGFRFEWIYGVAAVVTVFHDTLITVGAFSLTNKEISLTVIAAILTLIGYSNNDTIVIFDRIRENLKLMRREKLSDVVNRSINQTLSRTILTAGLTFLTVLALYLFGGEVLHGFSFALVIGILIGTYSSIAIAAPILVAYQDWRSSRGKPSPVMVTAGKGKSATGKGRSLASGQAKLAEVHSFQEIALFGGSVGCKPGLGAKRKRVVSKRYVGSVQENLMFEDSLIESGGKLKTKRGMTTVLSFIFQVMLIGVLVLLPLLFTEALPKTQLMTFLVAPPPPPPPPPPPAAAPVKVVKIIQTDIINGQLRTPTKIPEKVQMIKEEEAPPPVSSMAGVVGGVPGGPAAHGRRDRRHHQFHPGGGPQSRHAAARAGIARRDPGSADSQDSAHLSTPGTASAHPRISGTAG